MKKIKVVLILSLLTILMLLPIVSAQEGIILLSRHDMQDMDKELLNAFYEKYPEMKGKVTYIPERPHAQQMKLLSGERKGDVWIAGREFFVYRQMEWKPSMIKEWKDIGYIPVVLAVREGNPKGIGGWIDLTKHIWVSPDPETGGALGATPPYIIKQILGEDMMRQAWLKWFKVPGEIGAATQVYREVFKTHPEIDVVMLDEMQCINLVKQGEKIDWVLPIEGTLIEGYAVILLSEKPEARKFYDFLSSKEAQRILAKYGIRPVDKEVYEETVNNPEFTTVIGRPFLRYPSEEYKLIREDFSGLKEIREYYKDMFNPDHINAAIIYAVGAFLAFLSVLLMLRVAVRGAGGLGAWPILAGASLAMAFFGLSETVRHLGERYSPKVSYIIATGWAVTTALIALGVILMVAAKELYDYARGFIMR